MKDERGVYSIRVQQIYRVRQRWFFLRAQIALAQKVYSWHSVRLVLEIPWIVWVEKWSGREGRWTDRSPQFNLTFRGPCIVIYSHNENQLDALFLKDAIRWNSSSSATRNKDETFPSSQNKWMILNFHKSSQTVQITKWLFTNISKHCDQPCDNTYCEQDWLRSETNVSIWQSAIICMPGP